jgi:hypothetical protein
MSTNEEDLKLKVSSEGVEESASAFSRLNSQLQQTVAFVQQQAKQSIESGKASEAQGRSIRGLIGQLGELRQQYQQGVATGGQFSSMLPLMGAGISALISPIGLVVIGLGALAAAIHKAAQEAIQIKEKLEQFGVVAGTNARQSDVMIKTWRLAGADSEVLRMAMFRLSTQIESGGEILDRYGVDLRKSNGETKTAGELFEEFREKTQNLSDAQRNLALQQLYGRGVASQLASAMATNNDEMARYRGIAESSSNITEEYMKKAKALRDAQEELAMRTQNARVEFAEFIALPVSQFFTDATTGVMQFSVKAVERLKSVAGWMQLISNPFAFAWDVSGDELPKKKSQAEPDKTDQKKKTEPFSDFAKQQADREIQIDIDKRRQQLQADEQYFTQLSILMTGSAATSIALKQQTLTESIALADEEFTRRLENERKLSPAGRVSPEKQQALERERDQKVFDAKNQLRQLDLEREKVAVEQTSKLREDYLLKEKAILDVRQKMIDDSKQGELTSLEMSFATSERQILSRYEIETRAIQESSSLKRRAIDDEIQLLRTQADAFKNNADLQREINNKIIGLQRDRVLAEVDSNRQIMDARKAMVDKLIAEAQREAGAAGNLSSRAIANLRSRGKTSVSQSDINREIGNIQAKGAETSGAFATGGKVKISALEEAQATQGSFKDLASLGATITGAVNTMSQMMLKAFRGDLSPTLPSTVTPTSGGFAPAGAGYTGAGGRARDEPINLELERARIEFDSAKQAQMAANAPSSRDAAANITGTGAAAVSGTAASLQAKITEAASKAVEAIDFARVFEGFTDTLVRKLEFEAQRG